MNYHSIDIKIGDPYWCGWLEQVSPARQQQQLQPGPGEQHQQLPAERPARARPGCCWVERPQRGTGALRHAVAPGLVLVVKYQLQQQLLTTQNQQQCWSGFLETDSLVSLDIYYV